MAAFLWRVQGDMQPTSRFLNNENTLGIAKPHAAPHCRQRRIPATWLAFQSLHRLAGPPTSPPHPRVPRCSGDPSTPGSCPRPNCRAWPRCALAPPGCGGPAALGPMLQHHLLEAPLPLAPSTGCAGSYLQDTPLHRDSELSTPEGRPGLTYIHGPMRFQPFLK